MSLLQETVAICLIPRTAKGFWRSHLKFALLQFYRPALDHCPCLRPSPFHSASLCRVRSHSTSASLRNPIPRLVLVLFLRWEMLHPGLLAGNSREQRRQPWFHTASSSRGVKHPYVPLNVVRLQSSQHPFTSNSNAMVVLAAGLGDSGMKTILSE